jgi:hypothetical protein
MLAEGGRGVCGSLWVAGSEMLDTRDTREDVGVPVSGRIWEVEGA